MADLHTITTALLGLVGARSAGAVATGRTSPSGVLTGDDRRGDLEPCPWPEENVLEGDPYIRNVVMTSSTDGRLESGLWETTAGTLRVDFDYGDEIIHILEGEVEITDEQDGSVRRLGPGDVAHFRYGARTTWHVPEFLRKFWVTCEPAVDLRSRARRRLAA